MTARCCWCGGRPRGCSAACWRCPRQEPAAADWREAGAVDHVFTHFALTMRLKCAEADRRGPRASGGRSTGSEKRACRPCSPSSRRAASPGGRRHERARIHRRRPRSRRSSAARCRPDRGADGHGEARLLQLAELDPVLDEEGRLAWAALEGEGDLLFLGLEAKTPLFAPLVRVETLGQRAWSVFRLLSMMSARDAAIWGAARSLNEWHNRHGFCGICGGETGDFPRRLGPEMRAMRGRAFPARRSGGDHARRA